MKEKKKLTDLRTAVDLQSTLAAKMFKITWQIGENLTCKTDLGTLQKDKKVDKKRTKKWKGSKLPYFLINLGVHSFHSTGHHPFNHQS